MIRIISFFVKPLKSLSLLKKKNKYFNFSMPYVAIRVQRYTYFNKKQIFVVKFILFKD